MYTSQFCGKAVRYLLVSLLATTKCFGQTAAVTTDLPTLVSNLLNKFGGVPNTTTTMIPTRICVHLNGGEQCLTSMHAGPPQTVVQVLAVSNLRVITGQPSFGTPRQTAFPDQMTAWDVKETNCGPGPAVVSPNFSHSITHSSSVGLTHTITSTSQFSLSFSTGGLGGLGGPSVTAGMTFGSSAANATATTDLAAANDVRSLTASYTVAPRSAIVGTFEVWPIKFSLPFSVQVTVDGELTPNDKQYKLLSDIIPAQDRLVTVEGSIEVTEASEGQVLWSVPPDFNPATSCKGLSGVSEASYVPPVGVTMHAHDSNVAKR